jgi:hypothetical protein
MLCFVLLPLKLVFGGEIFNFPVSEKTIIIDGNFNDWTQEERIYQDLGSPDCNNAPGQDIREFYLAEDENFAYFRFVLNDVPDETFGYKFGEDLHVYIQSSNGSPIIRFAHPTINDSSFPNIPNSFVSQAGNQFEAKVSKDQIGKWKCHDIRAWCDQGFDTVCRDYIPLKGIKNSNCSVGLPPIDSGYNIESNGFSVWYKYFDPTSNSWIESQKNFFPNIDVDPGIDNQTIGSWTINYNTGGIKKGDGLINWIATALPPGGGTPLFFLIYNVAYDKNLKKWAINRTLLDNTPGLAEVWSLNSIPGISTTRIVAGGISTWIATNKDGFGGPRYHRIYSAIYDPLRNKWNVHYRTVGSDFIFFDFKICCGTIIYSSMETLDQRIGYNQNDGSWINGQTIFSSSPINRSEWYVSTNGSDVSGNGSNTRPFSSIGRAIELAEDENEIFVSSGIYTENLYIEDKTLKLMGGFDQNSWERDISANETVIDGGGVGPVITAKNSDILIEGFTIRNGQAGEMGGGGVYTSGGQPKINYCKIVNNKAVGLNQWGGGGICIGSAISPSITNSIVKDNNSPGGASGIRVGGCQDFLAKNVILEKNTGQSAFHINRTTGKIINSTIIGNPGGGVKVYIESSINIINSILWENNNINSNISNPEMVEVAYSLVESDVPGIGNKKLFHLVDEKNDLKLFKYSPCIDTGNPDPKYNDKDGTRNDMGAYGGPDGISYAYQEPPATIQYAIGILQILAGVKPTTYPLQGDVNNDGFLGLEEACYVLQRVGDIR